MLGDYRRPDETSRLMERRAELAQRKRGLEQNRWKVEEEKEREKR